VETGPREAIIALIENYTEVVLELDEVTVQGCAGFVGRPSTGDVREATGLGKGQVRKSGR